MVGPDLQVRFPTDLSDEEYVSQRAWNDATAPDCRWCGPDKCKLAPPGFYARVKPPGTRIRRFRCKRNGRTVSALPDCFNARMPGSLEALEAAAREAARAASWNAAVEKLRPPGQGRPASAERWLKRRVQWVSGLLVAVKGLAPERFTGVEPTLAGFGPQLESDSVLRGLRQVAAKHLRNLPAPVGFRQAGGVSAAVRKAGAGPNKQFTGLPPPGAIAWIRGNRPSGRYWRPRHHARRRQRPAK